MTDKSKRVGDLTGFQRDLLRAIETNSGVTEWARTNAIRETLQPYYSETVGRGRLSRNISDLERFGMVEVRPVDGRTKEYRTTASARRIFRELSEFHPTGYGGEEPRTE
jgi:DNA-binding MarR family transcriptional regulator